MNCNCPDNEISITDAAEIMDIKDEEKRFLGNFNIFTGEEPKGKETENVNIFILCSALVLLSDSNLAQKSELLIQLFDTNENYIIGDNELHILARCCIQAIAILSDCKIEIKTDKLTNELLKFTRESKYASEDRISVNDFTHFLLNTTAILEFLNQYGLFL